MKSNDKSVEQLIYELVGAGVFDSIDAGISIQDTDFRILYQNSKHKSFVGDHIGEYCYKAYEKRSYICEGCPLKMTFKDGLPHTEERTAPTDRGILHVEITASPLRDKTGKIIAGIEVARDITERKRYEEALKENEEKYRLLFTGEQDAILLVDAETQMIVDANDSALRLYGYSRKEILNLCGPDLSAEPEKSTVAIKEITKKTDKLIHYHTRLHKKKDGTVFPVEISSGNFKLQDKKIVSAMIRDITERKETEKALRESAEEFRALLESNPQGVQKIDVFGTIIFANKAHHEIYGYEEGALIGRSITDFLVHGKERDELPRYLEILVKDQPMPIPYHQKILTKSGKERDIEVSWNYLRDKEGDVVGFLSIITDITERKKTKKALMESENKLKMKAKELEESNTALKVLLKQRETDKGESEGNILANVKHLIIPYVEKLKKNRAMSEDLVYLNILESNLKEIISPFAQKLTSNQSGLTPKEIQVANLTT
jgi:PAS domain S-box-containing protein